MSDLTSAVGTAITDPGEIVAQTTATADVSPDASIVTADQPTGFTTITETLTLIQSVSGAGSETSIVTETTTTITDSAEYASLTSAAALDTSSSESISPSTSRTSAPSPSNPAVSPSPSPATSSSLATGAKVGIAIGVISVTIFFTALIFFFVRSRRRRRRKDADSSAEASQNHVKPELEGTPGTMRFEHTGKPELSATTSEVACAELVPSNVRKESMNIEELPSQPSSLVNNRGQIEGEKEVTPAENQNPLLPQPIQTPSSNNIDSSAPLVSLTKGPQNEEAAPKYFVSHGGTASQNIHGEISQGFLADTPASSSDVNENEGVTITRLKAEHAALAERIRLVEMKELERERGRERGGPEKT